MIQTIFLTGASGLVGGAFARAALRRGYRVVGVVHQSRFEIPGLAHCHTADLRDDAAVKALFMEVFPDFVVNCAAVADPGQCDRDPATSDALNVRLPATLAMLSHHVSARFLHVSSEQVFDGTAAPYSVGDAVHPLNLYARQKVASEQAVLAAAPEFAAVVRAPLLTGNSLGGARALHERLFADWAAGRTPRLFTDEIRQPCSGENLADLLLELCERPQLRGVFHWAGLDPLSRLELAQRIRAHFKLSDQAAPLAGISRADLPEAAASRPADLRLDLQPLVGQVKTPVESFDAQLEQLIVPPPCRDWYFRV